MAVNMSKDSPHRLPLDNDGRLLLKVTKANVNLPAQISVHGIVFFGLIFVYLCLRFCLAVLGPLRFVLVFDNNWKTKY